MYSSTTRFCVSLLAYSIFLIQSVHAQTDVWYEPMNSDPAQPTGWTGTPPSWATDNTACPGATAYCWYFLNSSGSYQRSASTTQFTSVQLTYSISSSDINATQSCYIDYSVDDTNFINIETIDEETGDVDATAQIYNSWTGAAGISSLTIQIGSIKAGAGCYFNEFRLSGTPITSQPTLPTTTPSDTPTNATSNSPSQPPTNAPSRAPTQPPTNAPSSAPSPLTAVPSDAPTAVTSQPTLHPTASPTYAAPVNASCGIRCTEYHINIAPKPGVVSSRTIAVQGVDPGQYVSYYRILLTPKGYPCTDPAMTATFQPIDYDQGADLDELLTLTGQYGNTTCGGSVTASCTDPFASCLLNQNLGFIEIYPEQETQIIQIMRGSGVNDLCDHPWAVNMQVTITCSARTSNPTNAPSTAPTTAPTSTTNHPTAAPSGTPSAAPSSSPSHPPSLTPTSAPTSAPSDTPTSSTAIPTNTPSATPTQPSVTPSQPPTRTPTAITSQPTPNPIIKTADCDTNRDCWGVKVTPVPLKFMSVPVTVLSGIEIAVDTYYDVTFTINTMACNRPSIDFVFEPTDNDGDGESLYVSAPGLSTQTCGGSSTYCKDCCEWFTCFSQMSVNNDLSIGIEHSITVTIRRASSVDQRYCDGLNDVKAIVTLNCDDRTTSPTSAPSSSPTTPPSLAPSDTPTSITTIPTNTPSKSPTHPTASPSRAPSQPPTNAPSSAPSVLTLNPTTSPTYVDPVTSTCYGYTDADLCVEYHINIAPNPGEVTSRTIAVQGVRPWVEESRYRILLTPKGYPCTDPAMTATFQPIDYEHPAQTLTLTGQYGSTTCGGSIAASCTAPFAPCLLNQNLGIIEINPEHETQIIQITRSPHVGSFHSSCRHIDPEHVWVVNMQVTITCSAQTSNPTNAPSTTPTRTPTAITSQPTPNPIIKTADCDTNRDCWSVNVIPVLHSFMSASVTVLSGTESAVDTYYDVTFTVNTVACNRPSIDFIFEPTDNDSSGESLYVSAPGLSTQTCGGSSTYCSTCCSWFTCLSQMSVNNDVPIAIGQSITVTIQRDSSVGMQYCDDLNDVKAKVTLNCDDSTTSPTSAPSSPPTAAPSSVTITPSTSPSPAPTSAPSDTPTSITTIPTNIPSHSPTQSPTNAPSQPPTNAPSQSPTHPSASPSHSPSQSPTNAPSSAPSTPTINPTASPTYADPVTSSCGTRCTEYHVNIAPNPGVVTSRTIAVKGLFPGIYVGNQIIPKGYYRILLTPKGYPCTDPAMTATFVPIDYTWLTLTGQYGNTTCSGTNTWCVSSYTCLLNQNLGFIEIYPEHETQIIQIMRGEGMDDLCDYAWSVNMQVTITCSARTANPTSAPSLAPTSPPTSAPSHAPTSITTIPTNVPSESPTHPTASPSHLPSVHSQPPTDVPSAPPTHPSVTPTVITSHPTPNPTIKTADCDTNRDCWSVNVTPVPLKFMSVSVTVLSGIVIDIAVDTYYDVTFTINTMACNRPSIDFVFEPTDNDEDGESLYVSAPGLSTQTCGGSSTYCLDCCSWFTCLSQMSVNNDAPIPIGQSITVTIQRDSTVDMHYCGHLNDVKAIVTLNCDDSTSSPTSAPSSPPTAAPSITPSSSPSPAPTSAPSDAPTSITSAPTSAPSDAPTSITTIPTNAPTPTRTPTVIASHQSTPNPPTKPTDTTLDPSVASEAPSKPMINIVNTKQTVDETEDRDAMDSNESASSKWDAVGYVIIAILLCIPVFALLGGLLYHRKQKGSDNPNYLAVVRCFLNIADVYTDFVFSISLMTAPQQQDKALGIVAAIFTAVTHIISISVCLKTLHRWRVHKVLKYYVEQYDALIIAISCLAGFYPAVDLLSSKLFHLSQTSFHLDKAEFFMLKQFRFFTNCLLENMPLMTIQIYLILRSTSIESVPPMTILAFVFSVISLLVGMLTLISRAFGGFSQAEDEKQRSVYRLEMQSKSFQRKHQFIHSTFQKVMSRCLEINTNRIETILIIPTLKGISIIFSVKNEKEGDSEGNENEFEQKLNNVLQHHMDDFKLLLVKYLNVKHFDDLTVTIERPIAKETQTETQAHRIVPLTDTQSHDNVPL